MFAYKRYGSKGIHFRFCLLPNYIKYAPGWYYRGRFDDAIFSNKPIITEMLTHAKEDDGKTKNAAGKIRKWHSFYKPKKCFAYGFLIFKS